MRTIERNILKRELGSNKIRAAWRKRQEAKYERKGPKAVYMYHKVREVCSGFANRISKAIKKLRRKQAEESRRINRR